MRNLELPAAYYERMYANDLHRRTGTWRPWGKQTGKFLWYATMLLYNKGPLLDIGCGAGHLAAMLRAFGRPKAYAGGIDCSRSAIAIAKHQSPKDHFVCGDMFGHADLLARPHYKTAVLLEILEHVYDDRELLAKIPVGRHVVISVPNFGKDTDGHCRWFGTMDEARLRYNDLVTFHQIVVEAGIGSDNRWFILKGIRI